MRHSNLFRAGRAALAGVLALICLAVSASPGQAASKSLQWLRLDAEVAVQPNGDLRVIETNVIRFTSGTFTFGYRDIDMSRLTGVTDIQVTEQDQVLSHESGIEDGSYRIKYYFASPAENEERTFVLRYTITGAARYYPDGDQVYWVGVYADRNGYPVLDSRLTIRLPSGATATQVAAYGPRALVTGQGEGVVVAVAQEPIDSGQEFEIRAQFPHGIIAGFPPPWQESFDSQRAYEETTKPVVDLAVLFLALLAMIGGPAAAAALWYSRGRDPEVGLVAEYLTEPPDRLTPGLAGVLVDERADIQDVIATLIDLARRGVLVMKEDQTEGLFGLFSSRDWVFARGPNYDDRLAAHERLLIKGMGLDLRGDVALSSIKNKFYRSIPGIQSSLYDQLVATGYYDRRPDQVRGAYTALAVALFGLAGILFFLFITVLADVSSTAICLSVALAVAGVAFLIAARGMPVRTRKGAEVRARLAAFKRYLENIQQYVDLKAATDQFDRYLPYAIAFGLDRAWIQKFAAIDTPSPGWYIPLYMPGRSFGDAGGLGGSGVDIGGAAKAGPSVQGLDRGLTAGLAGMNAGLTAMFAATASTFSSQPSSSGGGFSGGGGGGGGGSGGGGGGFG